ncbi:RE2, partial [Symbiodinium sp. CCMP2456]
MLEALTKSMTQLQEMQTKSLKKGLEEEGTETVKSTIAPLPLLAAPEGNATGIVLQDWIAQLAISMQDLSPSSGTWWEQVMAKVQEAYGKWLGSTPLERLQLQPQGFSQLAEGRWTRVNARACSLLLQSFVDSIRQDLIARRVVQNAVLIMFRLHTTYQPGGASEKGIVLANLQTSAQLDTLEEALSWLRSWPRWVQRCLDLHMLCPDGTVLARTLTSATSRFIAENSDSQFRTQLLRSTLRIDGQPSLEDVRRYHQHLQAELGSMAVSKHVTAPLPKIKALTGAQPQQQQPALAAGAGGATPSQKQPCRYFYKSGGCRRGAKCPYSHDTAALSKQERSRKCLSCGAEDHRQKDCPTKAPRSPTRPTSSSTTTRSPQAPQAPTAPKPTIQRAEPEGEVSPSGSGQAGVVTGEPVWTLESLLQAAAKVAGAKPSDGGPSLPVLSLQRKVHVDGTDGTYALVDSGATHALRRARSDLEWQESSPVTVNLAGGESVALRMNHAGTILVPRTGDTSSSSLPIVPLGALVEQLGYTMTWNAKRCKLEGRHGEVFQLKVREGCPQITESDALTLISRLEDNHLKQLKENVKATKHRVRAAALSMEKTWIDYLLAYALQAIEKAPFFSEVPECLRGLVEAVPEGNGWEALKGLEHLNRKARKKLWTSTKWAVHKFAGVKEKKEFKYLEAHGYTILELDIERGKTQDVVAPKVWKALERGARTGRIGAIFGGPPQNSFMISRHVPGGPEPLRSNDFIYGNWSGQSAKDVAEVNKHTALFCRMIYLHALSTAGRVKGGGDPESVREVGFVLEQPRDPRGYLKYGDPLYPDVVSFWRTSLWTEYALEAGLHVYSFDMAAFGKDAPDECRAVERSCTKRELPGDAMPVLSILRPSFCRQTFLGQLKWEELIQMDGVPFQSAATFGAKVMVQKKQMEGPKLDDLAPRWMSGFYVGRSESLSKGHLVYVKDDDGEKFVHTLHVRAGLREPVTVEDAFVAEEPPGPERRVRGKSAGSGDVVGVAKVNFVVNEDLRRRAEAVLEQWSQEEAEDIVKVVGMHCSVTDNKYGMFRHGGKVGITKATVERPWLARVLVKLLRNKIPEAEFASVFVSVKNEREVHIDRNNAMGTFNYLLPLKVPKRGGEIWQELRHGDVVSGNIVELTSQDDKSRYGCSYPLQEGQVFILNPHRRHAVLPWQGERLVLVGYTPGVLQNLARTDRETLWSLGFPLPLVEEEGPANVSINMLKFAGMNVPEDSELITQEEPSKRSRISRVRGTRSFGSALQPESERDEVKIEEWIASEMRVVIPEQEAEAVALEEQGFLEPRVYKAEIGYTHGIEEIFKGLDSPLSVVHTIHPSEVAACFQEWVPALTKEVSSLDHAVEKYHMEDPQVREDIRDKGIPMKIIYTVKPPDPLPEGQQYDKFYKRKTRIVVCGNLAATNEPGDVYTNTAPAEVVRAAIALAQHFKWNLGIIDVIAACLQTPLKEVAGAPLVYGVPPKSLVRAGLCKPGEVWKLTHAVYGLAESPRLWGVYRDARLATISLIYEGKRITLMQGKVEPSWWRVLQEGSVLVGIVVIYVDDVLICGQVEMIKELTAAIQQIWKTSGLQLVSKGTIRFLGIEISSTGQGFALAQKSYIAELTRIHQLGERRRDLIPVTKDQASFAAQDGEGDYGPEELKGAQQCAGEILWV